MRFAHKQICPHVFIFSHNTWADGQKIDYEYQLSVNREKVLSESLHYYPDGKAQCVYIRHEQQVTFGDQVPSVSTLGLRKNSSIISYAAQYETQVIAKSCQTYSVHSNLILGDEEPFNLKHLEKMLKNEDFQTRLSTFLQIADVGIETIALKKTDEEELNQLLGVIPNLEGKARLKKLLTATQSKSVVFTHKIEGNQIDFLNQELESAGTLQFLVLLYHILFALKNGSLLIVDEIELKLHPNLVAFLLGLFQNATEYWECLKFNLAIQIKKSPSIEKPVDFEQKTINQVKEWFFLEAFKSERVVKLKPATAF
jgi:hypothetical protein